jgi:hypothetical protein
VAVKRHHHKAAAFAHYLNIMLVRHTNQHEKAYKMMVRLP